MGTEWIAPKINWTDGGSPVGSDFNRIEGDNLINHEMILEETAARIASDMAEQNARIVGDNSLSSALNAEAATRNEIDSAIIDNVNGNVSIQHTGYKTISTPGESFYLPKGRLAVSYDLGYNSVYGRLFSWGFSIGGMGGEVSNGYFETVSNGNSCSLQLMSNAPSGTVIGVQWKIIG